jgi:membrane protease YdiL (CAAX protease family)
MEEKLKKNIVYPWYPWVILLGQLSLYVVLFITVLIISFISPAIPGGFIAAHTNQFALLLIILMLINQYGMFSFSEFLPRGKDYAILAIGLIIKFWTFGLLVGKEGMKADSDIMALAGFQYGFAIANLIFIGPLLEEIFLRRYFYEMLATLYSREMAVGLTVCISALLHWHPDFTGFEFLWHSFSALLFTMAYVMSRLGVSVLLHSFHNVLYFALWR